MNVATTMACGSVREREDTEVAKEFATSFAPMFHASWWAAVRYVGEEGGEDKQGMQRSFPARRCSRTGGKAWLRLGRFRPGGVESLAID